MLQLYFFGTPTLLLADKPLADLQRSRICLRLWAFLVLHRQQAHSRDRLATLFWPELGADRARRTLNNVVWRLRTALGEAGDRLVVTPETLQACLTSADWLDVTAFAERTQVLMASIAGEPLTQALAQAEAALPLYRGDLLDGLDDEWCWPLRTQWRECYRQTLERLAEACLQQQAWERGLTLAQQLLTADPDRQSGYQYAMASAVGLGRQHAASTYFAAYQHHWTTELGLPLASDMLALAARHQLQPVASANTGNQAPVAQPCAPLLAFPPAVASHSAYLQRQLEILIKNDELYDLMADRPRQHDNLLLAQGLADQLGDPAVQLDLLARRAWVATHQGDYAAACTFAQEGLRLAAQADLPAQRAPFHRQLGIASEELGDFRAALHHYTKALTLDEAQQQQVYLPADLNNVAAVQLTFGYYWQGLQSLTRAQALLAATPQPTLLIKVLGNLGYGWLKLGDLAQAQTFLTQANTLAYQIGEHSAAWWLATVQAKLYHLAGQEEMAASLAHQTYAAVNQHHNIGLLSYLADTLAWLYQNWGDGVQALTWAQQASGHAAQHGHWRYRVRGQMRLAQAYLVDGQAPLARAALTEAVKLYETKGQHLEEEAELYFTAGACAQALAQKKRTVQAQQQAETALARQVAAIPGPALQQRFLAVQRCLLAGSLLLSDTEHTHPHRQGCAFQQFSFQPADAV